MMLRFAKMRKNLDLANHNRPLFIAISLRIHFLYKIKPIFSEKGEYFLALILLKYLYFIDASPFWVGGHNMW